MAAALLAFPLLARSLPGAVVAMVFYGLTSTLPTVPSRHRLTSLAPGAVTEAMSLNSSATYLGISLVGALGGVLLSTAGPAALPYAAGTLALLATVLLALTPDRARPEPAPSPS